MSSFLVHTKPQSLDPVDYYYIVWLPPALTTLSCVPIFSASCPPATVTFSWFLQETVFSCLRDLTHVIPSDTYSYAVYPSLLNFPSHFSGGRPLPQGGHCQPSQPSRTHFVLCYSIQTVSFVSLPTYYNNIFFTAFQFLKWINKHRHFYRENYLPWCEERKFWPNFHRLGSLRVEPLPHLTPLGTSLSFSGPLCPCLYMRIKTNRLHGSEFHNNEKYFNSWHMFMYVRHKYAHKGPSWYLLSSSSVEELHRLQF